MNPPSLQEVEAALPRIHRSLDEAATELAKLERLRTECGCSWGARAMVAGGGMSSVLLGVTDPHPLSFVVHSWLVVVAAAASAVTGKVTAIRLARRRLRKEVGRITSWTSKER